jgi:hypothetical protein
MARSEAKSVKEYLAELPAERRKDIEAVRKVIRKNLPPGYVELMQHGMVAYSVSPKILPAKETYNKQPLLYAALAAQKNFNAVYLLCAYGDKAAYKQFAKEYTAAGKKLDMGKSCLRFKKLDDLPLEVIGRAIARLPAEDFVEQYKRARK